MIEHDKQSTRSLELSAPTDPESLQAAAGRRRFLKGLGVGLPAVMTLYHGAVLANASNLTCLANRLNNVNPLGGPLAPTPTTQSGDYVTTQTAVTVRQYTHSTNPSHTYYLDSVDGVWRDASDGTRPGGQNITSEALLDAYVSSTFGSGYTGNNISSPPQYAYAWIGDDGNVYALGNDNKLSGVNRELPAQFSCWASSHP